MVGPAAKREGVVHLRAAMGLSERRACSIEGADRTMARYRSCRPPDTELRAKLRDHLRHVEHEHDARESACGAWSCA